MCVRTGFGLCCVERLYNYIKSQIWLYNCLPEIESLFALSRTAIRPQINTYRSLRKNRQKKHASDTWTNGQFLCSIIHIQSLEKRKLKRNKIQKLCLTLGTYTECMCAHQRWIGAYVAHCTKIKRCIWHYSCRFPELSESNEKIQNTKNLNRKMHSNTNQRGERETEREIFFILQTHRWYDKRWLCLCVGINAFQSKNARCTFL